MQPHWRRESSGADEAFLFLRSVFMEVPKAYKRGTRWFLKLPGDTTARMIGSREGNKLVTYKAENHLFNSLNSFGFNKMMIMSEGFEILVVQLPGGVEYRVTKGFFLEHCILKSAAEGLDEQLHLPLKYFDPEEELAYQRRLEERKRMRKMSPTVFDILAELKRKQNDQDANDSTSR
jgi:hypothetical protein